MITHPNSDADTVAVLKKWTDRIDPDAIPVSILSNPTTMTRADVARLRDLGVDIFTVALDAATPALFDRTRGKGVQSPHTWAEVLGDPAGRTRRLRPAEVRRPSSSSAWARPSARC